MSAIIVSSTSAKLNLDNLTLFHRRGLKMAQQFSLKGLIVRASLTGGKQVKLSSRDELPEYEGQLDSIWLMIGNERGEAHYVAAKPTETGYDMRCTCEFAKGEYTNTNSGEITGSTCMHMMRACFDLEPEIIIAKSKEWKAEDERSAPIMTTLAAHAETIAVLPEF